MFEAITDYDNDDRGQVGIGTLIVFIAMVLVAAIAAGVLINTAGVLQTQASDTGSETQEAVANQIEVVHASGSITTTDTASSLSEDKVTEVDLTLMKSAGSNAIDLTSMTVQYTSDSTDQTLVHVDSHTDAWASANHEAFDTEDVYDAGNHNSLTESDDRVVLSINLAAIEDGTAVDTESNYADGLAGGESATVALVDQSGAQYTYGISIPSTFGDASVVEV